jgi:SAM-dependent MidA family methyltransferase
MTAHIAEALQRAGGRLDFSRFMDLCLYAPGLGYYVAGATKFGAAGDFVTAPEVSPLFGRCLARQIAELLTACGGDVIEFGAGSGRLARDVLDELEKLGTLPDRYLILEPGEELRRRQRATLEAHGKSLAKRVDWIDRLPGPRFRGVFLANEVLDALPIRRFRICADGPRPLTVSLAESGFVWTLGDPEPALTAAVGAIEARLGRGLPPGYESELSEQAPAWMSSVAECLAAGAVLIVDYGYPRAEYYLDERAAGTLVCHYRHRAHFDPLILAGIQDISASVDFTAVADAGIAAGLNLAGFCSQAWFLFGCGLDDIVSGIGPPGDAAYLEAARQAKVLTLPGEMGERFQVLAMSRGLDRPLRGFRLNDRSDRLGLQVCAAEPS